MKKSVHFTLLFLGMILDHMSGVNMVTIDFLTVALGDSVILHCSYNCSSGFVRGCWSKTFSNPGCDGSVRKNDFCTVSLHLSNVSVEDLVKNYTCYTIDTDDVQLSQKTERMVFLLLQDHSYTKSPKLKVTPNIETNNASLPAKPTDSTIGELTGIKVVAAVTVAVAVALAALAVYLCLSRNRQCWNCKGQQSTERMRIPAPDDESDTEVPYADIMITVRGVSTPELTQVSYLSPGDQKEWWGEEPKSHLQASRSADRLYIPQAREVSRKMSTSSEYAVITYA
ncbi:uncharacterized protein V6R79_012933 [Siganus canaliculatus]